MAEKARGMAVAVEAARNAARNGAEARDCPYKAKSWRSAWLRSLFETRQMALPGVEVK